jgi:hypothetical protein
MEIFCVSSEVSRLQTAHRLHCEVRQLGRLLVEGNWSRILWPDAHLFATLDTASAKLKSAIAIPLRE